MDDNFKFKTVELIQHEFSAIIYTHTPSEVWPFQSLKRKLKCIKLIIRDPFPH